MTTPPLDSRDIARGAIAPYDAPMRSHSRPWDVPEPDESHGHGLWYLIRRHALLIGICGAAAGLAGAIATSRLPRLYEASVSIRVDPKSAQLSALGVANVTIDNAVATELEMLRSRALAREVTDSLGLRLQAAQGSRSRAPRSRVLAEVRVAPDAAPTSFRLVPTGNGQISVVGANGEAAATTTAGLRVSVGGVSFRVTPQLEATGPVDLVLLDADAAVDSVQTWMTPSRRSREADLLDVRVRATDSVMVRDIANAFGHLYVANHQTARQLDAKRSVAFLSEQLARVATQLNSAERSLRDFRARAGVVSLPDEATTGVSRRAELLAQRNALDAEREALASLIGSTGGQGSGRETAAYRELLAFPTLVRSGAAVGLQSALSAAEQKRSELLVRRTSRDPEVQATEARIGELQSQLRSFATTYLEGLTNQVRALDVTLSRSDAALATLPQKELRQAELERAAKTNESVYGMLQARYKEAEIAAAATDASVRLIDDAVLPQRPVSPKPLINLALAVMAGLLLGVAGGFVREASDRSLRTRAQLLALTGSPVLSLIPRLQPVHSLASRLARLDGRRTAVLAPGGPRAMRPSTADARSTYTADDLFGFSESYARLVTNLGFAGHAQPIRAVLVTSALPGDGKTTVSTNLALTLAREGKRVLLIDADLRGGRVDTMLGLPPAPGLGEVLRKQVSFDEAVMQLPTGGGRQLHVLSRGSAKVDPASLLAADEVHEMLTRARSLYDMIVIDTPPVNSVADAALLTRHTDGVLVVARAGVTGREALVFAIEQLRIVRAPVIGAVLNDVDLKGDAGVDGAYQYYGQYSTSGSAA